MDHPRAVPAYAWEKGRAIHDDSLRSLRRAVKAGVRHVVSTDAGTQFNPHGGAGREVGYLVDWGMRLWTRSSRRPRAVPSCCDSATLGA